jgi:hypothetical protein
MPTNTFIKNNLITNFDLSDVKSYNFLNDYVISTIKYPYSNLGDLSLDNWGLNMYEVGRSDFMSGITETYNFNDNKLKLYKKAINDESGNTTTYPSSFFSATTVGYFQLQGGYFQNFFKLEDYNYELLPNRYNNGYTIETWIYNNQNTYDNIIDSKDGFFLYLGVRSENKFSTVYYSETAYTTTNNINLSPTVDLDIENSIYDNNLGFRLNEYGQIGYRYVTISGNTQENYSDKSIPSGWTQIVISFKPFGTLYEQANIINLNNNIINQERFKINWDDVKDCLDRRIGILSIYVNGNLFHTFNDFQELWLNGFNDIEKEKQIGLPYSISWGGGTDGLKNNWHFNSTDTNFPYIHNSEQESLLIEDNFDGSFYGLISILRIYDKTLNNNEILQNYNFNANRFGLNKLKGGRVIYV